MDPLILVIAGLSLSVAWALAMLRRDLNTRSKVSDVIEMTDRLLDKRLEKWKLEWKAHQVELESLYDKFTRMWGRYRRAGQEEEGIPTGRRATMLKRQAEEAAAKPLTLADVNRILLQAKLTGKWPSSGPQVVDDSSPDSSVESPRPPSPGRSVG